MIRGNIVEAVIMGHMFLYRRTRESSAKFRDSAIHSRIAHLREIAAANRKTVLIISSGRRKGNETYILTCYKVYIGSISIL